MVGLTHETHAATEEAHALASNIGAADAGIVVDEHAVQGLVDLLRDAAGAAAKLAGSIGSALSSASSASADTASGPGGMAEGGYIRGPGSGTSDSIPAWLSDGEFVHSARTVDHYGVPTMRALNNLQIPKFAMGGLVGFPSLPRFAEGGQVSSRAPVHLHLGGNSYALHGSDGVVGALVAEAHRQNMTSAGVKPSWFASRPSGR